MSKKISQVKHGIFKFRPKARLLSLLGHELISDEVIAVIELVKNSYDADSQEVDVRLSNIRNKKTGIIEIEDDGHGMTKEIIEKAWMEPARDNKRGTDGKRKLTKRFGRIPLGEKGVGRFSVDKLGLKLEIISRFCEFDPVTKEAINISPDEIIVVIEGKRFTNDLYLDELECSWELRTPIKFTGDNHGTLIKISELRNSWNYELVEKLRYGLARLSSPLSGAQDFVIDFTSTDFQKLSGIIENPLLKNATYSLDASIDENGVMTYTAVLPNETLHNKKMDLRKEQDSFQIKNGEEIIDYRTPECGPFRFKLFAFEQNKAALGYFGIMEKPDTELLKLLSGVSVYRDNFRVLPYGSQGNDWLFLDKRRIQNPGLILGNDRVIGYVEISQEINPNLKDKTNREGLIEEGKAFEDLRDLTIAAHDLLSLIRYQAIPHRKRSRDKVEDGKKDIEEGTEVVIRSSTNIRDALEKVKVDVEENQTFDIKPIIEKASVDIEAGVEATQKIDVGKKKLLEELSVSEEQIRNLISLSGIGMTAERMTHEFSRAVRLSKECLQKSLHTLNYNNNPETMDFISAAISQLDIVHEGLQQLEPLFYSKRRYADSLNVGFIARKTQDYHSSRIKNLNVDVQIIEDKELHVKIGKGELMQVLDNLFDNSLYWLKFKPLKDGRKIFIKISGKNRTIIFADNGQGVDDLVAPHIFDAFITTKPDGRGLGLYIAQDILQNNKAEIELITENKILEGANFKITFKESV